MSRRGEPEGSCRLSDRRIAKPLTKNCNGPFYNPHQERDPRWSHRALEDQITALTRSPAVFNSIDTQSGGSSTADVQEQR